MLPDRIEGSANYAFEFRGNQETSSRTMHGHTGRVRGRPRVEGKEGRKTGVRTSIVITGWRGPFIWGI